MRIDTHNWLSRGFLWWENNILRYPLWVIFLALFCCGLSLYYTLTNLGFNTDTTDMLSPDLPFHQNRIRYWQAFPQDVKAVLVVVDSATPESSRNSAIQLGKLLEFEKQSIYSVYVPGEGPFFDRQSLFYLDVGDLDQLVTTLSNAQPFLGRLAYDNSLKGLLSPLGQALTRPNTEPVTQLAPLLEIMRQALKAARIGNKESVSWESLMFANGSRLNGTRRFVVVKPKLNYNQIFAADESLQVIKAAARKIEADNAGVKIRMTGEIALQHEELESVSQGSAIATIASLILVCATLFLGLRSFKLMAAAVMSLIIGLILTAGFATWAVGHLNMISIAFAVLYIGLGVDYAIHLCLHYRDFLARGVAGKSALFNGMSAVGPAIILCAITSSVGFFSFVPTSYSGVSELGIISGTSMFIGLAVTLTVLPAFLKLMPLTIPESNRPESRVSKKPSRFSGNITRRRIIRWGSIFIGLAAAMALPRVSFDFDPVHLRDPNTESVITYNDLVKDQNSSLMTMTVLAENEERAVEIARSVERLSTVSNVITIRDLVPDNQPEKLALIDELGLVLGPLPKEFPSVVANNNQRKAIDQFLGDLKRAFNIRNDLDSVPGLIGLRDELRAVLNDSSDDPQSNQTLLQNFEHNLLDSLPSTVGRLQTTLQANPFDRSALPSELSERWLSRDGIYRIQIFPKEDVGQLENLRQFVSDVRQVAPDATDLPVIYMEAGKAVVGAFQQALLTALAAITLVLLVVLRSVRDTLLVVLPLVLAAMLTGAVTVIIDMPFNFANMIAIPLMFGLGVDSGIHVIHRLRNMQAHENSVLRTCTARGVFFSALTTIFSFSSLAFSAHLGTASMGLLLAVGIFFTLICTLVILPAFGESVSPTRGIAGV